MPIHIHTFNTSTMDPIKLEKFRAMNKYKRAQFIQVLFQYCLTALALTLLFSKSIWFQSLVSCVNTFFLVTLPKIGSWVTQPKCVFVVCNVIVMILVGESRLVSPNSSSPASEIYEEYVRRNKARQAISSKERKEETMPEDLQLREEGAGSVEENGRDKGEEKGDDDDEEDDDNYEKEVDGLGEENDNGMPPDELNKRIEAFFAKVKKQRKMEAQMLVCAG